MMSAKLIILCGLIGSGKTTYALSNFRYFTDLDYMNEFAKKIDQIKWTIKLLEKKMNVCHITTVPTSEELEMLKEYNPEFYYLDTDIKQCKINILIRNRKRDMDNIYEVFNANENLYLELKKMKNSMKMIKVFGGNI